MDPSPVRLVCFDLGGVIIRTCRTWREACEEAGLPFSLQVESAETEARLRAVDERHQLGAISWERFCTDAAEATGGLYGPDEIARIHDAWLLGEYPGMEGMVRAINDSGRAGTACLSNTNQRHWTLMETNPGATRFHAFHRLQRRLGSHQLGLVKPGEEIYREFERRNRILPEEILFFDDLAENVEAARRCGWRAEVVDHTDGAAATVRRALEELGLLGAERG